MQRRGRGLEEGERGRTEEKKTAGGDLRRKMARSWVSISRSRWQAMLVLLFVSAYCASTSWIRVRSSLA